MENIFIHIFAKHERKIQQRIFKKCNLMLMLIYIIKKNNVIESEIKVYY